MNKQYKSPEKRGIEWTDYTWNPVAGCFHTCQWAMPDGTIANCYAEDVADGVAGSAYPQGFEHAYWKPELLGDPLKIQTPSRVFVGSMADVFGHWVEPGHIDAILDACRAAHWHTFQFLTKNPKRALNFIDRIPPNCWIGASTPPDFMWNRPLKTEQRDRLMRTTLESLHAVRQSGVRTWISAEPITIDVGNYLKEFIYERKERPIDWMVIGAASNGSRKYAPDFTLVTRAVHYADQYGVRCFFKGNLRSLWWAADHWREDFPDAPARPTVADEPPPVEQQMSLF